MQKKIGARVSVQSIVCDVIVQQNVWSITNQLTNELIILLECVKANECN